MASKKAKPKKPGRLARLLSRKLAGKKPATRPKEVLPRQDELFRSQWDRREG
jgi:hypothetical protein